MRVTHKESGFTIIELLMVVAIIAIVTAIAYPQFQSYHTRAMNAASQADIKNLKTGVETFMADYAVYPSFLDYH
jgi:type IV pilus assembly protein PilA